MASFHNPSPRWLVAGAFDRFNFGDLLFPRVLKRALEGLEAGAPAAYFSTRSCDLEKAGGVVSRSLDTLATEDPDPRDRLVFAGGEILDAGWAGTYAALSTPKKAFAIKALDRFAGGETLARRLLGSTRQHPWVPSAAESGGRRTLYWSVGGCGLDRLPRRRQDYLRRRLGEALDLSVRDPRTQEILRSWGIDARLAPDGVVLVSDLFPLDELLQGLSSPSSRLLRDLGKEGYICLQLGRYPSRGHLLEIAAEVRSLFAATRLPILLLPLGFASAHEDPAALAKLRRILESSRLGDPVPLFGLPHFESPTFEPSAGRGPEPPPVTDLLALIASSKLFLGTSLHGNLTALTYGVPRVGLNPGVRKLDLFLKTWDPAQPEGCAHFSELSTRGLKALEVPPETLQGARKRVVEAGWENLRHLVDASRA